MHVGMYMWKLPVGIEWDYWGSMGSSVGGGGVKSVHAFDGISVPGES